MFNKSINSFKLSDKPSENNKFINNHYKFSPNDLYPIHPDNFSKDYILINNITI